MFATKKGLSEKIGFGSEMSRETMGHSAVHPSDLGTHFNFGGPFGGHQNLEFGIQATISHF